jgi:hypothetical protein
VPFKEVFSHGQKMETLGIDGIEFVLATLKEPELATQNVHPFVYTL